MLEVGVHKHVRDQLRRLEVRRQEEVQSQQVVEVRTIPRSHRSAQETEHIYDEQVSRNSGYIIHCSQVLVTFQNANLQQYSVF
jgi:hypothetical protein